MAKKQQPNNNNKNKKNAAQDKELKSRAICHCACLRKDQGYTAGISGICMPNTKM